MPESQSQPAPTPSTFARVGLLAYGALIIYASWYPFSAWRDLGVSPLAFLMAPMPRYWTGFDLITNVVAYIPLGISMVFALYPRIRGWSAVVLSALVGIFFSGLMEAVQTYLPTRVSSNLDLATNSAGMLIGALIGLLLTPTFLKESRILLLRQKWFSPQASRGLVVIALWPAAQIYPQTYLFGHGQIMPILSEWLSAWLSTPIDLGSFIRRGVELTVEQYWLAETVITACGLSGALLTLLCMLRFKAPKGELVLALIATAFAVKSMTTALLFGPENAFAWLTPGAQGGILLSLVMLSGLLFAPNIAQRRVAGLMLLMSVTVINIAPANPYFIATLQTWVQGKFLNFNGAAQVLSLVWPFIALWFLWHPTHRVVRH